MYPPTPSTQRGVGQKSLSSRNLKIKTSSEIKEGNFKPLAIKPSFFSAAAVSMYNNTLACSTPYYTKPFTLEWFLCLSMQSPNPASFPHSFQYPSGVVRGQFTRETTTRGISFDFAYQQVPAFETSLENLYIRVSKKMMYSVSWWDMHAKDSMGQPSLGFTWCPCLGNEPSSEFYPRCSADRSNPLSPASFNQPHSLRSKSRCLNKFLVPSKNKHYMHLGGPTLTCA